MKKEESRSILKERYKSDMNFEEALGLTIKAVLKEKKRKPDEIALALIDAVILA